MDPEAKDSTTEKQEMEVAIKKSEAKSKARAHKKAMVALAKSRVVAIKTREKAVKVREREVAWKETAPNMKAARAQMKALRARERAVSGREAVMKKNLKTEWDAREAEVNERIGKGLVSCRETLATAAELDKVRAKLEKQLESSVEQIVSLMWHALGVHPLTSSEREVNDLPSLDHETRERVKVAFEIMKTAHLLMAEAEDNAMITDNKESPMIVKNSKS